ncbi:kell blood group glycoprotein [Scleropages formosus]|uniref:Kell metallo-endopeptidase (Kell blood group) n=1 Tax=Scleropages formosus TaxID=113540 RepID=A0A8C9R2I0_SCLFO|nr:kell blood group glycoprotein-like [Scleropages formosus]
MINNPPESQSQSVQKPWPFSGQRRLFLVLSSSVLIILLCLGIYLHRTGSDNSLQEAPLPCLSSACLEAAAKLSITSNPLAQTCDNLLVACKAKGLTVSQGRQRDKQIVKREVDRYLYAEVEPNQLVRRTVLLELLREILESTDRPASEDSAEQKAQRFYRSCMDTETIEKLGPKPILKLVEKLGGWALSGKWNHTDFNATLSVLMTEYFTFPFFNIYVGRDVNSSDHKKYIQIDQPDFQIPVEWKSKDKTSKEKTLSQDLRHFLMSRVRLLGLLGVPSSSTSSHMGFFIQLSSELALFTQSLSNRMQRKLLFHRMTVKELQAQAPGIDWLGCLQAVFQPLAVSESDTVLLHNLPYITHMSKTISKWQDNHEFRNSGTLHTFMILSLLHTVIPALDSRFTAIQRNFSVALGDDEDVVPRWAHCVLQTEKAFGRVLSNAMRERVGEPEAEVLIQSIYSSLKSKLAELRLKDDHLTVWNKVTSLTPRLSPNADIMSKKNLDQQFSEVKITEDEYFSNYLQSLSLQHKRTKKLFTEMSDPDILSITPFLIGNEISFPLGMFVPPFFHPSYPRAVNYGALGMLMAKNILHLLLPEIQTQSKTLQAVSECVWALYSNITKIPHGSHLLTLTLEQQREIWLQYTALEIALQAYQKSLLKEPKDTSLSGIHHTHLFLTSFVQINCHFDPYHEHLPFEASFLVAAICMNSNLCPKGINCTLNTHQHFRQKC